MSGPCSLPDGDKRRWNELHEIVCDTHFVCWPGKGDLAREKPCVLMTYRVWLAKRGMLRTGKTR